MSRKRVNIAHQHNASKAQVRHRKNKLRERLNKLIDKLDCPSNQKVFHKQAVNSIIDERVDLALWDMERKNATPRIVQVVQEQTERDEVSSCSDKVCCVQNRGARYHAKMFIRALLSKSPDKQEGTDLY